MANPDTNLAVTSKNAGPGDYFVHCSLLISPGSGLQGVDMVNKNHPNYKPSGARAGKDPKPFIWTKRKCEVAADIAEGKYNHMEIAAMHEINNQTISTWKQNMEFMAYVDKLTLEFELATRAGLLRECYQGIQQKRDELLSDRTTHLDYVRAAADIQGLKKSEIELGGALKIDLTAEEALGQYENLLAKLAKSE